MNRNVCSGEGVCFLCQNEQQETAIKALESLCESSDDAGLVLSALRSVLTADTLI